MPLYRIALLTVIVLGSYASIVVSVLIVSSYMPPLLFVMLFYPTQVWLGVDTPGSLKVTDLDDIDKDKHDAEEEDRVDSDDERQKKKKRKKRESEKNYVLDEDDYELLHDNNITGFRHPKVVSLLLYIQMVLQQLSFIFFFNICLSFF
ncbi:unnamed protein product [Lactuca saligna]|uniref:Spt6 acidic N-terminal domain-containing protein n=1 Tax=Lactuca saligna TaxID=75948 RepID=A0AA35ZYS3_LACSI|nr:unnamed protein product [Lactuca saligna]